MYLNTDAERAQRQRDFYVKLTPQSGHILASSMGFTSPGIDSLEQEMKNSLTLWMGAHSSGAYDVVTDAAWWMTHFMDKTAKLSRQDFEHQSDQLTSFGVAIVGQLLDRGILQWTTPPEVIDIRTSTHDLIDDVDKGVLDRLDATLEEPWS